MNVRTDRSIVRRPLKGPGETRPARPRVHDTEWELTDARLDEALRQTFPASDALSIVQNVRGK
jgi:hypothetical protein